MHQVELVIEKKLLQVGPYFIYYFLLTTQKPVVNKV